MPVDMDVSAVGRGLGSGRTGIFTKTIVDRKYRTFTSQNPVKIAKVYRRARGARVVRVRNCAPIMQSAGAPSAVYESSAKPGLRESGKVKSRRGLPEASKATPEVHDTMRG